MFLFGIFAYTVLAGNHVRVSGGRDMTFNDMHDL